MKKKNILITGGTGYIGSHTAVILKNLGYNIILFDNLSNSNQEVLRNLNKISGASFLFVRGDVRDTELLIETFTSHKIEAVIHFAGLKAIGDSAENPLDYYSNNVQGAISLMQAIRARDIDKLIFSSSATVYGEPLYLPYDEEHPTKATNPYGRTKAHVEDLLKDFSTAHPEFRVACLRYFNPVGCHESGLIGDNPKGNPNNLMPFIAQVAIGDREELKVFGGDYPTADGTGIRDYIHVMDLAEGHAAALSFLENAPGCHTINLGAGKGYSVLEIISAFEQASNRKVPYSVTNRRVGDIAEFYSNPNKANRLLNWKTKRTLKDMCESTWDFQQNTKLGKG